MTENEVMEVLKNEKECVLRNIKGCDRDCGKCDLVMDESVIVNAYDRAIMELQENHQYRAIGTVEECREAVRIKKDVIENVNMQLIAGKNNYKEVYDSFYKIAAIVQKATDNGSST